MKRIALVWIILIMTAATVAAWQWPLSDGRLVTTFGQLRHGGFSRGVELAGQGASVLPASDGELVFVFSGDRFRHPLGNWVALSHDGGFRTLYSHLEDVVLSESDHLVYDSDPLGRVGSSGYVRGRQLGFQIIDEDLDAFVNPFLILPHRTDRRAPVIGTVTLERPGLTIETSPQTAFGQPGSATVLVDVHDPSAETPFLQILAPYEIVLEQDGQELRRFTFETLQRRESGVLLSGRYTADELYRSERLLVLGSIDVGDVPSTLVIQVRDFAGNTTRRSIIMNPAVSP